MQSGCLANFARANLSGMAIGSPQTVQCRIFMLHLAN
jgi:hypothetical protein